MFLPITMVAGVRSWTRHGVANDVAYGLTAGFYGSEKEADWFFENIQAGVTYANRPQGATTGAWPGFQPFRRLEGIGLDRQERRRALLRAAVHARADPHPDRLSGGIQAEELNAEV